MGIKHRVSGNNAEHLLFSVISKGINDAGRGLNIVVVGNGKEILKTAHFDTYSEGKFPRE